MICVKNGYESTQKSILYKYAFSAIFTKRFLPNQVMTFPFCLTADFVGSDSASSGNVIVTSYPA